MGGSRLHGEAERRLHRRSLNGIRAYAHRPRDLRRPLAHCSCARVCPRLRRHRRRPCPSAAHLQHATARGQAALHRRTPRRRGVEGRRVGGRLHPAAPGRGRDAVAEDRAEGPLRREERLLRDPRLRRHGQGRQGTRPGATRLPATSSACASTAISTSAQASSSTSRPPARRSTSCCRTRAGTRRGTPCGTARSPTSRTPGPPSSGFL